MLKLEKTAGQIEGTIKQASILPKCESSSTNRRTFLNKLGGAAILAAGANAIELGPLAKSASAHERRGEGRERARESFEIRVRAAERERDVEIPEQLTNGDERKYTNFIGSYSKGLPHNSIGEVDQAAYEEFLDACRTETTAAFENVPLGGTVKLVNPMSGIAFDLEGTDSHQLAIGPPPALASMTRADDMVEQYWMALCRDVNFTDYATDPTSLAAGQELSELGAFAGPKIFGKVTPQSLFRGFTDEDLVGPYVSQLFLRTFNYGQYAISGEITTYMPGVDYLKDPASWLKARNGQGPFGKNQLDAQPRFMRNGRDLAAYVHSDQIFEAFYNAGIWLGANGATPNSGNPYLALTKQAALITFGATQFLCLLAEASTRALKAVWYAKWFVHRTLRPEDYGGLVQAVMMGQAKYPLHGDVLNSQALKQSFSKYGSYLHAQAYPEGCPQHPSYAQGHGAVAGACATMLKAGFNGTLPFYKLTNGTIQVASEDGTALAAYAGADADQITINGEINKLASNIGLGRDFAGVHWRTDYSDGLKLGEAVALSILSDQKETYGEEFSGFEITKFDGTSITV
jgi:hypothetical protein